MPLNKYYSGPLIREGMEFEAVNLLGDNEPFNTQVASNFTKLRLNNTNRIKAFDMVDMETPFELLRHQNLDEKSPEWQATIVDISDSINLHADILRNVSSDTGGETAVLFTRENVIKDLIKQGIISSSEGLTDDTEITYDGKKYTFKQIMEEYQKAAS